MLACGAAARAAAATAPACAPSGLEQSAALAGGAVTVSPAPGGVEASYLTQISFLGVPATNISGVVAVGSRSGSHSGQLLAYSHVDGASFIPSAAFAQGEVVTVHALLLQGLASTPLEWKFTTAQRDSASRSLETPPPPPPPPQSREFQHFVSLPHLLPPTVTVTTNSGRQEPGEMLLAPYAGPGQYGPMILDSAGGLVWFRSMPAGTRAANLRVQEFEGRPVLTWWQDPLLTGGHSGAGVVIADSSYRDVAFVRAGNGYEPDLHAFQITPRGTALFTVYDAIRCNLRAYGGPANGAVADTLAQEIDLRTGLVRFEWHSLDHVALSESYLPMGPSGEARPWDYFHINGAQRLPNGELLIDARNTWAAYYVNAHTGQVVWRLGGKRSSFALGPGAATAWQHDVRVQADGSVTFFDNGGAPKVHSQSRGLVLQLNPQRMTAALVSSFVHATPLLAESQGDFEPLANGDWFIGWGQEPYFSELAPTGQTLFDAHLPSPYQSYTVLKYLWSGQPPQPPRLAVRPAAHGRLVVYASWNGATAVAAWRVLAGSSRRALRPIATAPRRGFETAIALARAHGYLAVRAIGGRGEMLGTSPVARG
jgi:hypothetical protein